jgi:glutamate formiminotransferase/formiminotetrahydrofolate cyclodeaminase
VRQLLDMVASPDEPAPAGGSTAALVAALSASLLMLVCRVAQRHADSQPEFATLLGRAEALQARLASMVDSDSQAFRNLIAVRRLPRRDANERTTRRVAVRQALSRATYSPLEIAAACADLVAIAERVEGLATGEIVSDARAARQLARAALLCSFDTVEQNLPHVRDAEQRAQMAQELAHLRERS